MKTYEGINNGNKKHSLDDALWVCNRALMGEPAALYNQLGDDKESILADIAQRADRYEQVIAKGGMI